MHTRDEGVRLSPLQLSKRSCDTSNDKYGVWVTAWPFFPSAGSAVFISVPQKMKVTAKRIKRSPGETFKCFVFPPTFFATSERFAAWRGLQMWSDSQTRTSAGAQCLTWPAAEYRSRTLDY